MTAATAAKTAVREVADGVTVFTGRAGVRDLADAAFAACESLVEWHPYEAEPVGSGVYGGKGAPLVSQPDAWWAGLEWAWIPDPSKPRGGTNELIRTHTVEPLPAALRSLLVLCARRFGIEPNQVQVNRYHSGGGVIWHSDLDAAHWLDSDTFTIGLGAARDLAVAERPDEWGARLRTRLTVDPRDVDFEYESCTLTHGSITRITRRAHEHLLHAIMPGDGLRYSVNLRRYRLV